MIEEMYQQEAKDLEEEREREREGNQTSSSTSNSFATQQQQQQQGASSQKPMPSLSTSSAAAATASTSAFTEGKRSADTMTPSVAPPPDRDPSSIHAINRHHQPPPPQPSHTAVAAGIGSQDFLHGPDDTCHFGGDNNVGPTTMIRFGTTTGDVSLTLGLRHAGNTPEKGAAFSVRDFGSC
ncbi:BEL1-like homeodomain protein 4 [Bienertia sinuspersici]